MEREEERSKAEEKTREESRRSIVTEVCPRKRVEVQDSRDLQTIRVIQKNLVYVIGIPIEAADTCGVYLTYETEEQALECIRAVDGYSYCRRQLK